MKNSFEIRGDITAIFLRHKDGFIETLIDTMDLEKAKEFLGTWHASWSTKTKTFYVRGNICAKEKHTTIPLHRFLCDPPKNHKIDHVDHDGLNNCRYNLRSITNAENLQNRRGANSNSTSGIRGVSWEKKSKKWHAYLGSNGKVVNLGRFNDKKLAIEAAQNARARVMPYA